MAAESESNPPPALERHRGEERIRFLPSSSCILGDWPDLSEYGLSVHSSLCTLSVMVNADPAVCVSGLSTFRCNLYNL